MASLSELMKKNNTMAGSSEPAGSTGKTLSQMMGIPTKSEAERLSIQRLNESRQRSAEERYRQEFTKAWEEGQRQQQNQQRQAYKQLERDLLAVDPMQMLRSVTSGENFLMNTRREQEELARLKKKVDDEQAAYDSALGNTPIGDFGFNARDVYNFVSNVYGTPSKIALAEQEAKIAENNARRLEIFLRDHKLPGYNDPMSVAMRENQSKKAKEEYEAKKAELKAAADAEQKAKNQQGNILLDAINKTISADTGAWTSYLLDLQDRPALLAYENFTAAEREAQNKKTQEEIKKWADEHPVLGSAASLASSPLSGLDYLNSLGQKAILGQTLQSATPGFSQVTESLREGASDDMSAGWKFVYNVGMSAADSLAANAIGNLFLPGGTGGSIILGAGAAASTANDIKERGGTDEQALLGGAVAGVFEAVFEKVSLGELNVMKETSVDTWKDLLKNVVKSVVTNASEEGATEFANVIFDTMFMGELSNYQQMVAAYMKQGVSEESAKLLATTQLRKQIELSALSGALMGMVFAGVASTSSYVRNKVASMPTSANQNAPAGVSGAGNVTAQVEQKHAPAVAEKAAETARDPIQVIREANEKAKAQQNEKTAAQAQRDVFESNTQESTPAEVSESNTQRKAPGFYGTDRFIGTGKDAAYLDRLAKAAGVSIEMTGVNDKRNGWIVNGEVYLNENAEDPLRVVAKHEITHHLKDNAGEAYGAFRNYVEEIYRSRGTLERQITAIQQLYQENGQELSQEEVLDELAADYAGELLDNEALIYKLAGENRNLAQRILDGIRYFIRRVKTAFGSDEVKRLDRAARLWENALREANAKNNAAPANGKIRYNFKDSSIERTILDYNDAEEITDAVADAVEAIQQEGAAVSVRWEDVEKYAKEIDWSKSNRKAARQFVEDILSEVLGDDSVTFSIRNGTLVAHLTGKGKNHYTGYVTPQKAALAEKVRELIGTARYAYSSYHDEHSKMGSTPTGEPGWDNFVAVAQIDGGPYHGESVPFVITTREVDSDQRAQIYDMQIKTEMATSHEGVSADAASRSNYGGFTISADKIAQERQSVKGSRDLQKQIDALERQNQRLKEQMKRTDTPKQNRQAVENTANALAKEYSSKIDRKVLADRLEALYDGIYQQGKSTGKNKLTAEQIDAEARSIAGAILDQSTAYANPLYKEYGKLRSQIRNEEIFVAEKDREGLRHYGYDGFEDFKKRNAGRLKFSKDGRSVESLYRELNEKSADLFPDDMFTPAEQLNRISEVLIDLDTLARDPYAFNRAETLDFLAGDIKERYFQTERKELTFADKEEQKRQRMRETDKRLFDAQLYAVGRKHQREVKAVQERYAEANRERIAKQNAAQRRKTIYRSAGRLANKLLRPTNKQHVPEELRGAAYNLLQYINLESGFENVYGTDAKYHRVKAGSELGAEPNSRTLAALDLKAKLKEMASNESLTIDPDMDDYLDQIARMGNKTLYQMSRAELDTVWNVVQIVEHTISRANELHEIGRYETLSAMANALRSETEGRRQRKDYVKTVGALDRLINFDMIDEATFFHRLGKPGDEIFRMMRKAEDRQTLILKEGVARAEKLVKESGVDFAKADKELHTFSFSGKRNITLSRSQIMELYALSKRPQAKGHILKGGLKPVGAAKGIVSTDNVQPVVVNWTEVGEIISKLTDEEKKLIVGLQSYLSNDLSKHGNEETMKVYGYKKFKEAHYWPIKVSGTETSSNPSKAAHAKTIPGYGMTKNVQPKAKNPVELHSAIDSFTSHLNQMATYAAWLGTNEDITRLLNYQYDSQAGDTENTVKRILATVYGKNGEKYINNLLSDIAQGTKTGQDKALTDSLFAHWKASKVGANIRVIVQQPTAILRAMAVMDPKYMTSAKGAKKGWEKAKKYAPIAQWKDWGYFEIGTGRSLRELITGSESKLDDIKNASMWAAGAMDSVSWGFLWNSVENEIADKQPALKKGSEEFYNAVADRFSEIIDRTQVIDSVLHRTQIMRSGNALNKMATGFMSEPSKIYNMVARNIYDLVDADSDTQKKAAYKALRRSAASLITSFTVNALVQSLVDALRDDDRDKKYWEKFAENYLGITGDEEGFSDYWKNFWSGNFWQNFNPLSYVPYVKDIASIAQGYEVDRSDMAAISDLFNALQNLGKSISGEGTKTTLVTGIDAAAKFADLLGLPVSNLKRDVVSAINTVLNEAELYEVQYALDKIVYNEEKASGVFYGDLYRTMNNDYDAYEDIYEDMYERMIERGYEEDEAADKISDAMENKMKKQLGVESVKSLPVRYTPPTSEDPDDPFLALMKKAKEQDTGWVEQLDPGSIEIALAVDEIRDAKTLEKIKLIASQPYGEDLKRLAMRNFMADNQWSRYLDAISAGVSSMQYVEFLEAIAAEAQRRTGKTDASPAQADVLAILKKSKLNSKQKRAIWNGYGWKADSPW